MERKQADSRSIDALNLLIGGNTVPTAQQVLDELIQIQQQVGRRQGIHRLRAILASLQGQHPEKNMDSETAEGRAIIAISYLAEAHDRRGLIPDSAWSDAINRTREWIRSEM